MAGRGKSKTKLRIIHKKSINEWLDGDNLLILKGIALQCLTYQEIADCIGVTLQTLVLWRKKYPEIAEAIELGREEADAVVLAVSFDAAIRGDAISQDRWWKYRLAQKFKDEAAQTADTLPIETLAALVNILQSPVPNRSIPTDKGEA